MRSKCFRKPGFLRASVWAAAFISFCPIAPTTAAKREVTVGVVPQQSAGELASRWVPVLQYLGSKSNLRLSLKTARDTPTFEHRLSASEYDIAYMNPYHYTVFQRRPGYRAFAKEAYKRLVGIVVVHKDSPVYDIVQLAGTEVAYPAPAAFAATILPSATFAKLGVVVRPRFVGSDESVYLGVAKGLFAAGTGVMRTFDMLPPEQRGSLRILWKTPAYTPHPFAYHPRLSRDLVARLERAMFEMHNTTDGRLLLEGIGFAGIVPATDKEYDAIRRLNIRLLNDR